jgi:prophage antirepressor-like protein
MRLVVSSKLPAAQRIEEWIFDEVIVSVMTHGAYMLPEAEKAFRQEILQVICALVPQLQRLVARLDS